MTTNFFTPLVDPFQLNAAAFNTPLGQLDSTITNLLAGAQAFTQLSFGAAGSTLVIATDTITITKSYHAIDTEAAAATDDLKTISGGTVGDVLVLHTINAGRVVVIKHGTGNIFLTKLRDITLYNTGDYITLIFDGSFWVDVGDAWSIFNLRSASALTIASDTITASRSRHTIDTEGGAATDNLLAINGGIAGDVINLSIANNARTVTVISAFSTGNILLENQTDITLSDTRTVLQLTFNGGVWVQTGIVAAGQEYAPRATYRKYRSVIGSGATFEVSSVPAVTASGTLSNANDGTTTWVNALTGAVAGNTGGFITTTFNLCRRSHFPTFHALIQLGAAADIANIRIWIGLVQASIANVDAAGTQCAAFRYSTVAADPGFVAVCNDGGAQTVSGLVANGGVAAGANYLLSIRMPSYAAAGYVTFQINGGALTLVNTNLPAAATDLGFQVRIVTTNAAGKNMAISYAWEEHN